MKKILIIIVATLMIGCTKNEPIDNIPPTEPVEETTTSTTITTITPTETECECGKVLEVFEFENEYIITNYTTPFITMSNDCNDNIDTLEVTIDEMAIITMNGTGITEDEFCK